MKKKLIKHSIIWNMVKKKGFEFVLTLNYLQITSARI